MVHQIRCRTEWRKNDSEAAVRTVRLSPVYNNLPVTAVRLNSQVPTPEPDYTAARLECAAAIIGELVVAEELTRIHAPSSGTCFHVKCFFANARPEPDFKYFSNAIALDSLLNSSDTTRFHGRSSRVYVELPALCTAILAATSVDRPV